ncbi:hypothetical protein ACWPKO_16860 [Coraliomargarita sp. W4R53]
MKEIPIVILISTIVITSVATAAVFTGSSVVDQNFSNADNWDAMPENGDTIEISASGTSNINPAIINSSFNVDFGGAKIFSSGGNGTGMSYVEIVSGGELVASYVDVGNASNIYFNGTLTLRSGGAMAARYLNSGGLTVGGNSAGTIGVMTVEDGATFSHANLKLNAYGTLTFKLGASSTSTFISSQSITGNANVLDGLLQVDLDALTTTGSYTLIDSSSDNLLISGALHSDLISAGGSITSGSQSNHFNVLNQGDIEWNLTIGDGGRDLILNVTSIPELSTSVALFGSFALTVCVTNRRRV